MKNSIIYVVVFIALQLGVSAGGMGIGALTGIGNTSTMLIITMAVYAVITAAIFLLLRWAVLEPTYLRSRPWIVLFWTILAALGMIVPSTWLQERLPELPNLVEEQLGEVLKNKYGYYVVGLLVPFVEEIVFRGAILRALLSSFRHHWVAIAISALFFAAVHANPAQMPHAFIVGILLGWMYYRTKSIIPGVAYHWVNNSVAYVLYNVLPDPDAKLITIFGSEGNVLRVVLCSLCILLPSIYQLHVWMKPADKR